MKFILSSFFLIAAFGSTALHATEPAAKPVVHPATAAAASSTTKAAATAGAPAQPQVKISPYDDLQIRFLELQKSTTEMVFQYQLEKQLTPVQTDLERVIQAVQKDNPGWTWHEAAGKGDTSRWVPPAPAGPSNVPAAQGQAPTPAASAPQN